MKKDPEQLRLLENWMRSQRPDELFDGHGKFVAEFRELGAHRHAAHERQSARQRRTHQESPAPARLPRVRPASSRSPAWSQAENTRPLGVFLRDVMKLNMNNFRVFGPDENTSNKLDAIYEVSKKFWIEEYFPEDLDGGELSNDGRVMEMLSEHTMEGMLEGYLLTGRHGFFSTYESFVHVIDSMFNQHAKWLEICNHLSWREAIASLNLLITSTVWRQDHNGFTHQDPGFLDVVVNKSANVTRIYLPPDVNSLLSVADHCLRSQNYVNVIVCDKQNHLQYMTMDAAITHCTKGIGIWDWASNDEGGEPDVVMASAGDIPTQEALAATVLLRAGVLRHQDPVHQRDRSVQDAAQDRASARASGQGFRFAVHPGQADHLQLPRISVADSPPGLPAPQPRQHACARLQGEGQHQHAAGAGDQQQHRSLQPGDGRDRPRAAIAEDRRTRQGALPEPADRMPQLRARIRHRRAESGGVGVAVLARCFLWFDRARLQPCRSVARY